MMRNKRVLSLVLSLLMLVTIIFPAGAFAENDASVEVTSYEEVNQEAVAQENQEETSQEPEQADQDMIPEKAEETVPEEVDETVPEEVDETVPEEADETVPEEIDETVPEEVDETVPEEVDEAESKESKDETQEEVSAAPAETTESVFEKGYILIKEDTVVFSDEEMTEEAGTIVSDSYAYAEVDLKAESEANTRLYVVFDTAEARQANTSLPAGFILFKDIKLLTNDELDALKAALQQDQMAAEFEGYLIPLADFVLAEEEIQAASIEDEEFVVAATSGLPTITVQPQAVNIETAGETVEFSVVAENATSYQWKLDTGNGWIIPTNTKTWKGATTDTLTFTGSRNFTSYKFKCVVSNENGSVESDEVQFTIGPAPQPVVTAPTITVQPQAVNIETAGETVEFSVVAENATSYQWKLDTGNGWIIPTNTKTWKGATTDTLTFTGSRNFTSYKFKCVVSNENGSVESDEVQFTIGPTTTVTSSDPVEEYSGSAIRLITLTSTVPAETSYMWMLQFSTTEDFQAGTTWFEVTGRGEGASTATVRYPVVPHMDVYYRAILGATNADPMETWICDPEATVHHLTTGEVPFYGLGTNIRENTYGSPSYEFTADAAGDYTFTASSAHTLLLMSSDNGKILKRDQYQGGPPSYDERSCTLHLNAGETVYVHVKADRDYEFTFLVTNETNPEPFIYERNNDGLTVTQYLDPSTENNTITSAEVPTVVAGMTVTQIGPEAFMDNTNITTVALPNSITVIGARAFKGCVNLSQMTSHD